METENQSNLVVSTLEDENDGDFSAGDLSLREAIANAEAGATITFDPSLSGGTILLDDEELSIDRSLTIDAASVNGITIDGDSDLFGGEEVENRVLNIDDGDESTAQDVVLNRLTISGGSLSGDGAGILNQENLTLNNSIVSGNTSFRSGGGINNSGTLNVTNSTISSNYASDEGGGIKNNGTVTIDNSTIANNSSLFSGGGIASGGSLEISNSTITNNEVIADDVRGYGSGDGISGSATITSSIVSGNGEDDITGAFTSGGNNLVGNAYLENFENNDNGDILGEVDGPFNRFEPFEPPESGFGEPIDALLGELQDNGGAVPTIELLEGSPAIDAGSNPNNLATDQRGNGFESHYRRGY